MFEMPTFSAHTGSESLTPHTLLSCETGLVVMFRAHSFPGAAEFRAEPRNLGFFPRVLSRGITAGFVLPRNPAEFHVFHSNNYFFTENDLKVALLQVC